MGYRLAVILGLAVCAVLAGARSFTAIAEWAADAGTETLARLGVTGAVPSESAFRRALQRLGAGAFDDLAGRWAQSRTAPGPGGRRVIAVDGKTLRGSGRGGEDSRHLLAALDHAHGVVLGQIEVDARTSEIPMFTALCDRIEIKGRGHHRRRLACPARARPLPGQARGALADHGQAQPARPARPARRPALAGGVPAAYDQRERGHGRAERRALKVTTVARGLAFPDAAQAIQVTRRRTVRGKRSRETCSAVTSLTVTQASPARLAAIIRGYWGIEDRLHWVRDLDFGEDRSQVRAAGGPAIMASLRNLAISILRLAGHACTAAALRHHARQPARPPRTIMKC